MQKDSLIYVAGHNGMVGSAIVRELKHQGYMNIITRTKLELDLKNTQDVNDFFCKYHPEYVYLAAAKVGGIHDNNTYSGSYIYENLMIQTNVINACILYPVKKLVFLGSSCIYPRDACFGEVCITEDMLMTGPLEQTNSAYAIAKIAGIEMCKAYAKQYGLNCVCIMPTNLYGIGDNFDLQSSHVLPALIAKVQNAIANNDESVTVWGSGNPRREFLYVDDLAKLCVLSTLEGCTHEKFEIYNAGCGDDISIKELAQLICDISNYKGKLVFDSSYPDGTYRKLLNVEKVKHAYGWQATTSLEEGIKKIIDYYYY